MELCIRIAFWILTFSVCLQVKSLPVPNNDYKVFELLKNDVKCTLPGSRFYTPEIGKDSCITTALQCIQVELSGTVTVECGSNYRIDQANEVLLDMIDDRTKNGHALTNSTECACENWTQTPFSDFVTKTITFLENMNVKTLTQKAASAS